MSREIIEKLEEIAVVIPKRFRPRIKDDNVFTDESYIDLNHNKYTKITIDVNQIVLHRHRNLFGFGPPSDYIRMYETCDGNVWEEELLELLTSN